MVKIKICGITNKVDAINAADLGIDMMGFVFYKNSERYVDTLKAADIINEVPSNILKVGVFVDEERGSVLKLAEDVQLDMLQFHGNETPEYCDLFKDEFKIIKAFRIRNKADLKSVNDYNVDYYLFDNYKRDSIGGTGEKFDWNILDNFEILKPLILSGGLTPENVTIAMRSVAPYAVDVSSGVERSPGVKDALLMKKFVENARKYDL